MTKTDFISRIPDDENHFKILNSDWLKELETKIATVNSWRYVGKHTVLWDAHWLGLSVVMRIRDKLWLKVLTHM